MSSLQPVRGTHDLLFESQAKHNIIIQTARQIAERFHFSEISTPIFEFSDVFKRTLGEASDIVSKEMYTFQDRSGDELTLRPEGTAGVARSFISEGLTQKLPLKFFYQGPMFRYERPQKGRQRQFHQIGAELLGVPTALADIEIISLAYSTLDALRVLPMIRLEINSIGDIESRTRYVATLTKYLEQFKDRLSADSQRRLTQNPLRILDSKDAGDQELLKQAPMIAESYNETSKEFLRRVTGLLGEAGIPYQLNPHLVRGLDYYTHCVFEFKTNDLGAQDTVISGGRYDQLIKQMGGPETCGVGFGGGVERLVMLSPLSPETNRPVTVIPVHASVEDPAYGILSQIRLSGITAEMAFSGNLSKRMKRASAQNSWAAVVVGPDELSRGEVMLKLFDTGEQRTLKRESLTTELLKLGNEIRNLTHT
jgi:histidyl-tRNA synthetase